MLDVLSVFERLSDNVALDQRDISESFRLLPTFLQRVLKDKDSEGLRHELSLYKSFSDAILAFQGL